MLYLDKEQFDEQLQVEKLILYEKDDQSYLHLAQLEVL
jgi:hypothetical protein